MTAIMLATGGSTYAAETLTKWSKDWPQNRPAGLVSAPYLKATVRHVEVGIFRTWYLDSGAYSVKNTGKVMTYEMWREYVEMAMSMANPPAKLIGLDVINDPGATYENWERAVADGLDVIPIYHLGAPEKFLKLYVKKTKHIALGNLTESKKMRSDFCREVFNRIWPAKIHGLGIGNEVEIMTLPFHSVDTSSWETSCAAFGRWVAPKGAKKGPKGKQPRWKSTDGLHARLYASIENYLAIERRAKNRWAIRLAEAERTQA